MPCWFYEKKDLRNTASYQDGISPEVEARYRREGARFILDAGTKMGLYPFPSSTATCNVIVPNWMGHGFSSIVIL